MHDAAAQGQAKLWSDKFTEALATRYDHRGMRHTAAVWRRWVTWLQQRPGSHLTQPGKPSPLLLTTFLEDVSSTGPTAAQGVLNGLKWMAANLGMQGLPLASPLVQIHMAPGCQHIERQAPELRIEFWQHILEIAGRNAGAVSLMARLVLFMVASSLRFQHAQRFRFLPEECDCRTLVGIVSRGKVRKGAPFKIAVPTHVAPRRAMLMDLYQDLQGRSHDAEHLVPDISLRTTKGLTEDSPVLNTPMPYGKFMGCLRALMMSPPLALSPSDASKLTSYSLRRKLPTVADRLRLDMAKKAELGDWKETPAGSKGHHRRASEPMAVRYSAAKLESAAQTRRLCLLALSKVDLSKDEDVETRRQAKDIGKMLHDTLGDKWGISLNMDARASSPQPIAEEPEDDLAASMEEGFQTSSDSSSKSWSEPGSEQDGKVPDEQIEWMLPAGARSKLHLVQSELSGDGQQIPWCRKGCFRWGFQTGLGMNQAEGTGRSWSPRCASELGRLRGSL